MTTFAERLKNAMEQANMSQSALSEQAGASKAAISQYLSGKNTPGPDRIKALADATGVSFDYLMGYGAAPVAEPPIKKISVKEPTKRFTLPLMSFTPTERTAVMKTYVIRSAAQPGTSPFVAEDKPSKGLLTHMPTLRVQPRISRPISLPSARTKMNSPQTRATLSSLKAAFVDI